MHPAVIVWLGLGGSIGWLIGHGKGQGLNGLLAGVLLGPLGWLLVAFVARPAPKCPSCKEWGKPGAKRCKWCGDLLPSRRPRRRVA